MKINSIYFIIAIASVFLSNCTSKSADLNNASSPIPVIIQKVRKSNNNNEISISGNIEGNSTVKLGFMVAGKVNHISIKEGEHITKGGLVAGLDPENYAIAKEIVDVQVNQLQDEYDRLKLMHERKSISESDFSKINYGLQQAKAQQKLHSKNLSDTKLHSPIDGVLLKKMAEVGEIVGTGTPLFVVSDIHHVKVSAFVPENELHQIKLGQRADVFISSLNQNFEGKVIEVGSAAEATSRAFSVKIKLSNPDLLIRPGMIAEVKLPSDKRKEIIALPAESILRDLDNQSYVYVVDTVKNKAFKRKISIGALMNNEIEITSGLTADELVVTGGQQKVTDGSSVILNK